MSAGKTYPCRPVAVYDDIWSSQTATPKALPIAFIQYTYTFEGYFHQLYFKQAQLLLQITCIIECSNVQS